VATLRPGLTSYERAIWTATVDLPLGRHEVAVCATDLAGERQPDAPVWNRRGYGNHAVQRLMIVGR
jgi:hypothetical protein